MYVWAAQGATEDISFCVLLVSFKEIFLCGRVSNSSTNYFFYNLRFLVFVFKAYLF